MSYYQLHIHAGAAVSKRQGLIRASFDEVLRVSSYDALEQMGCRPLAFGASTDHFHVFYGLNPKLAIDHSVESVKERLQVELRQLTKPDFSFQIGHWAITVSPRAVNRVVAYVENQRQRHGMAGLSLDDEFERKFD